MTRGVIVEAPAKINLHLRVFGRRSDGYHDILSLFQAVSLSDTLELRRSRSPEVMLSGDFDCSTEENTIVRAARGFLRAAKVRDGLEFLVDKRIPAGAGLGGGSSDAAAALRALNVLYGEPLSGEELLSLGASVGSDVPFFLNGACAIVSGRGETVELLEGRTNYWAVLLYPGFPTPTGAAYATMDSAREAGGLKTLTEGALGPSDARGIRNEYAKSPETWEFGNDFQDVLMSGNPELGLAYEALIETGASFAGLSGSGSSFFGIYGSPAAAERAALKLNGREGTIGDWFSVAAAPLARMPILRLK